MHTAHRTPHTAHRTPFTVHRTLFTELKNVIIFYSFLH